MDYPFICVTRLIHMHFRRRYFSIYMTWLVNRLWSSKSNMNQLLKYSEIALCTPSISYMWHNLHICDITHEWSFFEYMWHDLWIDYYLCDNTYEYVILLTYMWHYLHICDITYEWSFLECMWHNLWIDYYLICILLHLLKTILSSKSSKSMAQTRRGRRVRQVFHTTNITPEQVIISSIWLIKRTYHQVNQIDQRLNRCEIVLCGPSIK